MSRAIRVVGALLLVVGGGPVLGAGTAQAAVTTETASVGAYYWAENPGTVQAPSPLGSQKPFPEQAKAADGVAEDDLAVAVATPDRVDKFSVLRWELESLLPGSVVSKAVVVVPLSTNANSRRTPNAAPELIQACGVGDQGFADADAEPFIDAPKVMCDAFSAKLKPVKGGYEFDVTALAQTWVNSNDGVALYPSATGMRQPFQQVFAPKGEARLTLAFTPPAQTVTPPPVTSVDTPPVDPGTPADLGGGLSGGTDPGAGLGTTAGPAPAVGAAPAPPVTAPTGPAVGGQPQTAVRVAGKAPLRFDGATWAAILGGAVLLWLASMSLGARTPVPAAQTAVRPGGVAAQLSGRSRPVGRAGMGRPSIV